MAEAFATFSSVLTLLDVTARIATALRTLYSQVKNAPDLICALANNVADLQNVLDQVNAARQSIQQANNAHDSSLLLHLDKHLTQARAIVTELDDLANKLSSLKTSTKRIRWCLQNSRATSLLQGLKDTRGQLMEMLVSHGIVHSNRISRRFDSFKIEFNSAQSAINKLQTTAETTIDKLALFRQQSQTNHRDLTHGMDDQFGSIEQRLEASFEELRNELSLVQTTLPQPIKMSSAVPTLTTAPSESMPTEGILKQSSSTTIQDNTKAVQMSMRGLLSSCPLPRCRCSCHLDVRVGRFHARPTMNFRLPPFFASVLGTLFFHYSSYPVVTSPCDYMDCFKRQNLSTIQTFYTFPTWLVQQTIQFVIAAPRPGRWTTQLVFRRRIKGREGTITWKARGDPKALNLHLVSQRATLDDIHYVAGASALHFAIGPLAPSLGYIERIKMLLAAGADPDYRDDNGLSPRDDAAELILSRHHSAEITAQLNEIVSISDILDDLNLTFVHRIVLGICPIDLSIALSTGGLAVLDQLNTQDLHGNTPLHHAAILEEATMVRTLLAAGADPNLQNYRGRTPIMYALHRGRTGCVSIFLDSGLDLEVRDAYRHTLLHSICQCSDDVSSLKRILELGAKIDDNDNAQALTPLHFATQRNNFNITAYLSDYGADIQIVDMTGGTALGRALYFNSHQCQKVLLERGAALSFIDKEGEGCLHYAAGTADVETIQIIAQADLRGLQKDWRNHAGYTAYELFQHRLEKSERLVTAFAVLLKAVDEANESVYGMEEGPVDVFEDAVEHQSLLPKEQ